MKTLTETEKRIIERAVKNADVIGAGRLTYAQHDIVEYGFTWTDEHERYAFEFNWDDNYDFGGEE